MAIMKPSTRNQKKMFSPTSGNYSVPKINTLYHGSAIIVQSPDILTANRPMYYGSGFYCTTSKLQAKNRAISKTLQPYAFVNIYSVDPEKLKNLRILRFEKADTHWVDFVEKNRRQKGFMQDYDIVIGPVADDRVNRSFSLYESRIITKLELISRLKAYKLVDQYLFHTKNSLKALTFIRAEKVIITIKKTPSDDSKTQAMKDTNANARKTFDIVIPGKVADVVGMILNDFNATPIEAINAFYVSPTYAKLETENTKYWHLGSTTLYQDFLESTGRLQDN